MKAPVLVRYWQFHWIKVFCETDYLAQVQILIFKQENCSYVATHSKILKKSWSVSHLPVILATVLLPPDSGLLARLLLLVKLAPTLLARLWQPDSKFTGQSLTPLLQRYWPKSDSLPLIWLARVWQPGSNLTGQSLTKHWPGYCLLSPSPPDRDLQTTDQVQLTNLVFRW